MTGADLRAAFEDLVRLLRWYIQLVLDVLEGLCAAARVEGTDAPPTAAEVGAHNLAALKRAHATGTARARRRAEKYG